MKFKSVPFVNFGIGKKINGQLPMWELQIPLAYATQQELNNVFIQAATFLGSKDIFVTKVDLYSRNAHRFIPNVCGDVYELVIPLWGRATCHVEHHNQQLELVQGWYQFAMIPQGVHPCFFPKGLKSFFYIQFAARTIEYLKVLRPDSGILAALESARKQGIPFTTGNEPHQVIDAHFSELLMALMAINGEAPDAGERVQEQAIALLAYALDCSADPMKERRICNPFREAYTKASRTMARYVASRR